MASFFLRSKLKLIPLLVDLVRAVFAEPLGLLGTGTHS